MKKCLRFLISLVCISGLSTIIYAQSKWELKDPRIIQTQPDLVVEPDSIGFGDVSIKCSFVIKRISVRNKGSAAFDGRAIVLGQDTDQFGPDSFCANGFTLDPGDSLTCIVFFEPNSLGGKSAILTFQSNDPGVAPVDIPLTGAGVDGDPDIAVSSPPIDYGNVFVGSSGFQPFFAANNGPGCMETIISIEGQDKDDFSVSAQDPMSINSLDLANVVVSFIPTSEGQKSATLQITTNDPDSPALGFALTGTGITPPPVPVDAIDLALVIDVSASIDSTEYRLQLEGFASAIADPTAVPHNGKVSTSVIQFASNTTLEIPLTLITDQTAAETLANTIRQLARAIAIHGSGTGPGNAIDKARIELATRGREGSRKAICLVTDGEPNVNEPIDLDTAIDNAKADNIDQLDVFVIEQPSLVDFYRPKTFGGGPGVAFAKDFVELRNSVGKKIGHIIEPPICDVTITSPLNGALVCSDTVRVTAFFQVSGSAEITCNINGIEATPTDSLFSVTVPLQAGENQIIATCAFNDTSICADTISVFADLTPPVCNLDFSNFPTITGEISDAETGITRIEIIQISNRIMKIDTFQVSELDTFEFEGLSSISFVLEKIDPKARGTFTLRGLNGAGCEVFCDPIDLTLSTANSPCNFNFSLPHTDRYLHVENHGLSRIEVLLNEKTFNLVAPENGLRSRANSYIIPSFGSRAFDLSKILLKGDNNIQLVCEGTAGSYADILIADFLRPDVGEPVILELNDAIPSEFALMQNYPNPFNPSTTIRFNLPEAADVKLKIYNTLGQLVKTLISGKKQAGVHSIFWDGVDEWNERVASGVYVYVLKAGDYAARKKLVLLK